MTGTTWIAAAVCAQVDPDLWQPDHQGASPHAAKAICATCPVAAECLTFALGQADNPAGVWGGTTERERRVLRRGRRAAA